MKMIKYFFALLIVIAVSPACPGAERQAVDINAPQRVVVRGNNKFALELYAKLRVRQGNLFFSPYSISTALAMAYAGARGQTESQMAEVLHFANLVTTDPKNASVIIANRQLFHCEFGNIIKDLNDRSQKGRYELRVANALWCQKGYGLLKGFLDLIKTHYGGGLNKVDFVTATEAARKTINSWVQKQTNDKIKDLIQPGVLDELTRLVLTNAIYFKGNWARKFQKDRTTEATFTLLNGNKVEANMMNQTAEFKYTEVEDFQALDMPYVENELSMIILLPKKPDGLVELEKKLTEQDLSHLQARLVKRKVIVSVPKFKMTSQFGLARVLKAMGMKNAFSSAADFSGINGKKDLFISAVIHKAFVEVNEEGTEAAAATAVTMRLTAVEPRPPVFRADHPFVFFIRDNKSGSILFLGRVMDPKS